MIVADASVVLKWVLPDEADREKALLLRDRHLSGENPIAAPDLLFYEIANVLPLRWGDLHRASEGFREIDSTEIERCAFEAPQFVGAMELARRHSITLYDASYLLLAQALRCPLVTADERLLARLKGVPLALHLKEAAAPRTR